MRYLKTNLLHMVQTGTDMLGNPVVELQVQEVSYKGRFTPWTAAGVELEGREVTQNQRRLLTNAPLAACLAAAGVQVGGEDYKILSVEDLHRWRLVYVGRWR